MIMKSSEFVTSAVNPPYPPPDFPEIAFGGRSNVGKSTLINTLVNRKKLVKTSSTPGRTQLINFFIINEQLSFVDLPGYGYAKVPVAVKKNWGPMVETYLSQRENLRAVVLILDIRREPRQEELNFMDWLAKFAIPYILVITKTDKLSKTKQTKQHKIIADTLSVDKESLILFSAKTRMGLNHVWAAIEEKIE